MTHTTAEPRRVRRRAAQRSRINSVAVSAGRTGTTVLAASGLAISIGAAANAADQNLERGSATVQVSATELTIERASNTTPAAITSTNEVSFDRPAVTSETAAVAPEPVSETDPEPQAEQPAPRPTPAPPEVDEAPQEDPQPAESPQEESAEPSTQQSPQGSGSNQSQSGSGTAGSGQSEAPSSGNNSSVVSAAYAGMGTPYLWGGTTTSGFDCSGFINWAYNQAGRGGLPRTTYGMESSLPRVSSPQPGDIVLANNTTHGGIYVGNGQVISATPSGGVRLHGINEGWHQVNAILRPN
ncbi:hypothetical protein FEF26_13900 [Nesterenkonia salmonea]|uniref:NlpC/P60 domain-containing protein n=1 Tax=Nesterenkonia salmonea TaxID=1804987 RepID=A0A5R9B7F3_9MICC|nr:C40 family peptidase [Nesterenkonia salmonea]TLP93057.1 hypothetical protein FEF26_13900 [Nesterenkonia salmonea]